MIMDNRVFVVRGFTETDEISSILAIFDNEEEAETYAEAIRVRCYKWYHSIVVSIFVLGRDYCG
jgi:hypothetical protein